MKVNFLKSAWTGITTVVKTMPTVIKANSPAVLAGTAILGAVAVLYTTFKCAPKYHAAIEEKSKVDNVQVHDDGTEEHTVEYVGVSKGTRAKIFVKTMLPAIIALVVTCASVIGSHKISAKRIAVLSAAYATAAQKATEAAEKRAEEFIKSKIGNDEAAKYKEEVKKEQEIAKKAATNISSSTEIIETGGGNTLFYDYYSGRMFRSSEGYLEAKLEAAISALQLTGDDNMWVSYNEILDAWGVPNIGLGEDLGFDINFDAPALRLRTRPINNDDIVHRSIPTGPENEAPWVLKFNLDPEPMPNY